MTAGLSLHQRILSDVQGKILSGAWAPGYRIPFEHELSAQYGCSRMTVNKALSHLAGAGLIERRRKAGSFVSRPQSQSAVLEIHEIAAEVAALGLPYGFTVLARARRRAHAADRARLGVDRDTPVLDIICRHVAGPHPFCLEERLISLAAVPEAAEEAFVDVPPGTWLMRRVPWTTADHAISATGASGEVAASMALAPDAPCLVIERRTWSADQPITAVRLTYPGDAHRLVARFAPTPT